MRRIAVLDAPSNLGLRPPTETSVPGCAKAPGALRDHGLLRRLDARDAGCLTPPRYDPGDWRPGDGVCHAPEIALYSRRLADRIGAILDQGEFPVVLGGDCSIVLGSALAMHRLGEAVGGRIGLIFVDGHSDFRHPGNASYVGAAAGEDLALVTGRGQADLAAMEGRRPYYRDIDVVVMGIRAQDEYRLDLQAAGIVTRPVPTLRAEGAARSAQWAREQLVDCAGYWVHLDVDVLDPAVMPAVDAPEPGGIAFPELELLLADLVESPHCLGVEITVFDPDYDPDGRYAEEITAAIVAGLKSAHTVEARPDLIAARKDLLAPGAPGRLAPPPGSIATPAAAPASLGSTPASIALPAATTASAQVAAPEPELEPAPLPDPASSALTPVADADSAVDRDSAPDPAPQPVPVSALAVAPALAVVPVGEEPGGEDAAGEDPAGEDLAGEDLAAEEPGDEDLAAGEPGDEDLAGEDLTGEDLAGEEPVREAPVGEEPGGPVLEAPVGDEGAVDVEVLYEEPAGDVGSEVVPPVVPDPFQERRAAAAADGVALAAAGMSSGGPGAAADGVAVPVTTLLAVEEAVEVAAHPVEPIRVEARVVEPAEESFEADYEEPDAAPEAEPDAGYRPDAGPHAGPGVGLEAEPEARPEPGGGLEAAPEAGPDTDDEADGERALRPLGQAPLLDSEPLPATMPGMLRPRAIDDFSLPVQRPAFEVGPEAPADVT